MDHSFEDLSVHGSATLYCEFCGVWEKDLKAKEPCPKAEQALKNRTEKKENEERWEYERMKKERERFVYLESKYGIQSNV